MRFKPGLRFTIGFFLFTILNFSAYSQAAPFDKEWKQVDFYLQKERPRSALNLVKTIYQKAKSQKQEAQVIKSLIYMIRLQQDDNNESGLITTFEKEAGNSSGVSRSILNSLLAKLYWDYYLNNQYKIRQRTTTEGYKKEDIATWTYEDFQIKITDLYLSSLRPAAQLQQTRLDVFEPILEKGNVRHLRPTVFDLLAHEALYYFENNDRNIQQPSYAFEINDVNAFAPASDFINHLFITRDSLSPLYHALVIYQQLLSFHLKDADPGALIDADMARIQFAFENGTQENKDDLYRQALKQLTNKYPDLPAATQAWYLLANDYFQKGQAYQPFGDTIHRYDKIMARQICEKVLAEKDSSEGKINCYNLLGELNQKQVQFEIEKVNLPGQPFRSLVRYKNLHTLYLRLVQADTSLTPRDSDQDDDFWKKIAKLNRVKTWTQPLPETSDLQEHAAEIKIDGLKEGEYFLWVSSDENFDERSVMSAGKFYVSNISYINKDLEFFILDRESGYPLSGAEVQLWKRVYDNKTGQPIIQKFLHFVADAHGYFNTGDASEKEPNADFSLEIKYQGHRLFIHDDFEHYYYNQYWPANNSDSSVSVFLFTDRSIYRPGQELFFKGIAVEKVPDPIKKRIKSNYESVVYLRNVNSETVDSMAIKTNDFGSFSGRFRLPSSGLNGTFRLEMKNNEGVASLSVEEYKRPKFYVGFDKITADYRVNDTINISGFAKSYAGNNIDQARVQFRVVRRPRIIFDWIASYKWLPGGGQMEIAHGETSTDRNGKFNFSFKAIPDSKFDPNSDPVFDYTVYADVTDINGETRTQETFVSAGYHSLILDLEVPDKISIDSFNKIRVHVTNMAGEWQPTEVTISIYKLKEEQRLIRKRYWDRPDQFTLSREEYTRLFPKDEYDNETDIHSWERERKVFELKDSTDVTGILPLHSGNFENGFYAIEVSTRDKYGNQVKETRFTELFDPKNKQFAFPQYLWSTNTAAIEPGETAHSRIGSSADSVHVFYKTDKLKDDAQTSPGYSYFTLNHEKKEFSFIAKESDRGGFGIEFFFIKDNRFYEYSDIVMVPWSNKQLDITYETFRDKTLPGSSESWKLKLKGYHGEKIAAEMLASMYDASLDQFKLNNWEVPEIWPSYSSSGSWNGDEDFVKLESTSTVSAIPDTKELRKEYDQLIFSNENARYYSGDVRYSYKMRVGHLTLQGQNNDLEVDKFTKPEIAMDQGVAQAKVVDKPMRIGTDFPEAEIRKNFNETAFFFPALYTDSAGAIEFSFTMPESVTQWKLQLLAHTKALAFGSSEKEIVTQKKLMVQPNVPRFLREGDKLVLSAKIVNLTNAEFTGQAQLQLIDPSTSQPVDGWFQNIFPVQFFTVAGNQSEAVAFPLEVPYNFSKPLEWRIVATAKSNEKDSSAYADGEQDELPVLTNKILVTESLPVYMNGPGSKSLKFENLLHAGSSETLQNYNLSVEYATNPAWYAVQSLPFVMEYPYECAEQTWNRYYANSLAAFIANSSPRLSQLFQEWKNDSLALVPMLAKNPDLKSVLLEETPWVTEAKSEEEQMKNITLLFNAGKMSGELDKNLEQLKKMQNGNGGFSWFEGGPVDRYITQYIVSGLGHLVKLKAVAKGQPDKLKDMFEMAIVYLDKQMQSGYQAMIKSKIHRENYIPDYLDIQYLYARSFFLKLPVPETSRMAYHFYIAQCRRYWTSENKYMQGMIALALARNGDSKTSAEILRSLKETAIHSDEMGMYWKNQDAGWFWYQSAVESQSLLVEAFDEVANDKFAVDKMKTWLLKNKQTNHWSTTRATAEACYALLLKGSDWFSSEPSVSIHLGNTTITNEKAEAGTGYFRKSIDPAKIDSSMGNISFSVQSTGSGQPSWGAVYWQYFENMDKIKTAVTPLQLSKKLFVEKNADRGPVLKPVDDGDELHVGDKVMVRIELRVDREMEYVHMKDTRASCLEPVNVLSSYKWQDGLGYYESTMDASTNFFFDRLRKGTYVFEYPLYVSHTGNFSNGITSVQCMYAPEFSSHSEGTRIIVAE